jgi:regulator of sigma E protease
MGGIISIAKISGDSAHSGILDLIYFMAVLSVNLGLINLFPIPVLDGGHLLFYAVEAVRGKPPGETVMKYSFRFGLALVLSLAVFANWNDLVHLGFVDFVRDHMS